MTVSTTEFEKFDQWAIVDVMGHQRYIGRVTEQVVAGQGFVRVDVPETEKQTAWTKLIGTGSIYAITPVTEEIARAMANVAATKPVSRFDLPSDFKPRIAQAAGVGDDYEFDGDDEGSF